MFQVSALLIKFPTMFWNLSYLDSTDQYGCSTNTRWDNGLWTQVRTHTLSSTFRQEF